MYSKFHWHSSQQVIHKSPINKKTEEEDDLATLVGSNSVSEDIKAHRSTSTKRRKRHNNSTNLFSLDKHKTRIKKESLFIKQIKLVNMFCMTNKIEIQVTPIFYLIYQLLLISNTRLK